MLDQCSVENVVTVIPLHPVENGTLGSEVIEDPLMGRVIVLKKTGDATADEDTVVLNNGRPVMGLDRIDVVLPAGKAAVGLTMLVPTLDEIVVVMPVGYGAVALIKPVPALEKMVVVLPARNGAPVLAIDGLDAKKKQRPVGGRE